MKHIQGSISQGNARADAAAKTAAQKSSVYEETLYVENMCYQAELKDLQTQSTACERACKKSRRCDDKWGLVRPQ